MLWIFLPFAISIAVTDMSTHRIPNRSLIACASLLFPIKLIFYRGQFVHSVGFALIVILASSALSIFAGLGAGDVKLVALLALLVIPPSSSGYSRFLAAFLLGVSIQSLIYLAYRRSMRGDLPLGPAIVIAAIWSAS